MHRWGYSKDLTREEHRANETMLGMSNVSLALIDTNTYLESHF